MRKKITGDDAKFAKLQKDWQKQVQKFMVKAIRLHEELSTAPNVAGMQETLLFSVMWVEFVETYRHSTPNQFETNVDFLKHMFKKIMDGDLPGNMRWQDDKGNDMGPAESNIYKKPTIN